MGILDKLMKRNKEGLVAPQYFNKTLDQFEEINGSNGAIMTQLADPSTPANKAKIDANGNQLVALSGSSMELYGPTVNERPAANTVRIGAIYMAVDTQETWQSNGTTWKVI